MPFSKDFNKKLIPAYNQLHDKGLDILGMSWLCSSLAVPCVDDETYLKYLEDANIPWKIVLLIGLVEILVIIL